MNGCVIPGTSIAVDFWLLRKNAGAKLFFLTHLHGDHVVGLTSSWKYPIHCSPVTAELLVERHGIDGSQVRSLAVGQPHVVSYCQGHSMPNAKQNRVTDTSGSSSSAGCSELCPFCGSLCVTVIDANHCAGAVMFLFEGSFGKILYTGDFRFHPRMFEDDSVLLNHVGTIDKVYLDNTYCSPECIFPSRRETFEEIIKIIEDNADHDVVFGVRGLGKEELLAGLGLALTKWINVSPQIKSVASLLDLPNVFTTDEPDSQFRVVPFHKISKSYASDLNSNKPTIIILPTALYEGIGGKPYCSTPNVFVVPYSDHSSYPELVQFVSKLRPACVVPIVSASTRGPFGLDISNRADMSCFQQYLSAPRDVLASSPSNPFVTHDVGLSAGQSHGPGFESLFPDLLQRPPLKRKKSSHTSFRSRRKVAKGVIYTSNDSDEEGTECENVMPTGDKQQKEKVMPTGDQQQRKNMPNGDQQQRENVSNGDQRQRDNVPNDGQQQRNRVTETDDQQQRNRLTLTGQLLRLAVSNTQQCSASSGKTSLVQQCGEDQYLSDEQKMKKVKLTYKQLFGQRESDSSQCIRSSGEHSLSRQYNENNDLTAWQKREKLMQTFRQLFGKPK